MVKDADIGIAVAGDFAVIVSRQGRSISAPIEIHRDAGTSWPDLWLGALGQLGGSRRLRTVSVVLDAPRARQKLLFGLPLDLAAEDASREFSRSPDAFFVATDGALVASDAARRADGWWGSVVDRSFIDGLVTAFTAHDLRLMGVLPMSDAAEPRGLTERAQFALTLNEETPLLVDPFRATRHATQQRRARTALSLVLLVMLTAAAVAPGLIYRARAAAVQRIAARAQAQLERLAAGDHSGTHLALMSSARTLDDGREARTVLLGRVARALPDSAAIVSVAVDSTGVQLSVLAPQSTDVVGAFGRVPGFGSPTLVGAITREALRGVDVQRTTLMLAFAGLPRGTYTPVSR